MVAYQVLMNSFIMKFNDSVKYKILLNQTFDIEYTDTSFSDSCITFTYESFSPV